MSAPPEAEPPAPPEGADPSSRNPFTTPAYRQFWLASVVVGVGVGIQSVAVPLFIRDRTQGELRAIAIAGALIAQTLPAAVLALVGGSVADRVEQRFILARSYAVAALVACAYVALSGLDVRVIWPVFPLAAVVGSAAAFTNPARNSMVPQLLSRAQLQNGVIFSTMGFMATMQFVGPGVGGLLVDGWSLPGAFSAEVVLVATGALLFSRIRTRPPEPRTSSVLADLREGLRYAAGDTTLTGLLLLSILPGVFFIGPFAVTVPLLVPDVFGESDRWVGFLWSAFGAGVLIGSIGLTLRPARHRGLLTCASTLAGGLLLTAYGASETLWLSTAILVCWGLGASVFINYAVVLLQENTEPAMMGRVMSMYSTAFFLASPIGYAQAGALTSFFGPQFTLIGNGVVAAAIGLGCTLFLHPVRRLD